MKINSRILPVVILFCLIIYVSLYFGVSSKNDNANVSDSEQREQRDTITNISYWNIKSLDGIEKQITTYERIYRYEKDTIFHVKEDYLNELSNPDSLFHELDSIYASKLYIEGSEQRSTYARYCSTITTLFEEYVTVHIDEYFKEKEQGLHGDGEDYYYTYKLKNDTWHAYSIFVNPNDVNLKSLVGDAIIEYRKKYWWRDENLEENDIKKWKDWFMGLDISVSWYASMSENGILFSFDYGDAEMGICFAENYIHALVPYSKLKGMLVSPFNNLTQ